MSYKFGSWTLFRSKLKCSELLGVESKLIPKWKVTRLNAFVHNEKFFGSLDVVKELEDEFRFAGRAVEAYFLLCAVTLNT